MNVDLGSFIVLQEVGQQQLMDNLLRSQYRRATHASVDYPSPPRQPRKRYSQPQMSAEVGDELYRAKAAVARKRSLPRPPTAL
ncbi:unnamed protein product [Gongylonema pulchrum]|uniref:CDI domain-containing protein n=1 Tax=Gongylonema pulchrum TaxID=637853 RepID=A0A183CVW9_9BILA|nr:unnamed protein product [Gongylonema pulchrum]